MAVERQTEQALLQFLIFGQIAHRTSMHYASVIHYGDMISQSADKTKILFDQKNRRVGRLEFTKRGNQIVHNGRSQTFGWLVD